MGLFSSIGGIFNDLTGSSSAASLSHKYSSALASQNAEYQREFAKNAHQWEVEDLKKAGLNPVLSAGGSGASASGGGGGTVGVSAGAGGFSEIMNSAKGLMQLSAELGNIDADTKLKGEMTGRIPHEVKKINSDTAINNAQIKKISSDIMVNSAKALQIKSQEDLAKTGLLGKVLGTENTKKTWKGGGNFLRSIFN